MEIIKQKLQQLIEASNWSAEDRNWFLEYLDKNDTSALQQLMQEYFSQNVNNSESLNEDAAKELLEFIHQKIVPATKPAKVIHFAIWKRIAAAAAVLIIIAGAAYFFLNHSPRQQPVTSNRQPVTDIVPGGNKAVLTLANNQTIILDNAQNGTIARQGNTRVLKLDDGRLSYNLLNEKPAAVLFNTITTPRGGQYQLTLSDGSKVWLNAASSIRFPTAFVGNERKVEITGEAYFEVTHDATKPFKVNVSGKEEVEVLGTHFNINSYSDEATINTTLLEGKVKVTPIKDSRLKVQDSRLLSPGEQSQLTTNNQINISKTVDITEVMAWKNGQFNFNSADIENIMRQVSRWYDVDVVYQGKISKDTYSGIVSRNSNVSEVLKIMQQGGVKFTIEGKKITVLE